MKKLIKVDPFYPLSRDMNSLVHSFFGTGLNDFVGRDHVLSTPAINVTETDSAYTLEVAAPGLKREQFNIEIDGRRLTISAEQKEEKTEEKTETAKKFNRREFNYSQFSKSFTLPKGTTEEHISARYEDGVLLIDIAKVQEETKIKKLIEIS